MTTLNGLNEQLLSSYEQRVIDGINALQRDIHETARDKGWWEEPASFGEIIALIHSELSEALEEYRKGIDPIVIYTGENGKPEGIPIELADAVIRIMDYCGWADIDLARAIKLKAGFNKTRPYKHGGKKL